MNKTIYWRRECQTQKVTIDEFNKQINKLKANGYKQVNPSIYVIDYEENTFSILEKGKYRTLAVVHELFRKELFSTNFRDDDKNLHPNQGKKAFDAVTEKFRDRTGVGVTKAFGSVGEEFKTCVPRQFYYLNEKYLDKANAKKHFSQVAAIDYCSQYPSMLCGRLPDGHNSVVYQGTVAPTEVYPFAFYLKSGHCAEFGVFDTHNWKRSFFRKELLGLKENKQFNGDPYINEEEDITVLMKACKYSLQEEMEYFYSLRKTDNTAKLVMNAFIGFLHRENYNSHKQAHIAAIVIARANDRMRKKAEEIQYDLGFDKIIHICVDGCIYQGNRMYGQKEKALNNLTQEFFGCDFKITGTNSFVAMKDGKVVKFRHGAYDSRSDGKNIEECSGFGDMYKWFKKVRE